MVAIALAQVMYMMPMMTDDTTIRSIALQVMKLELFADGLCVLSLAMSGDQPWLFIIITLLLYRSYVTSASNMAAMWFITIVLNHLQLPDQNIYNALWLLPTLGLLGLGASVAVQRIAFIRRATKIESKR